MVTGCDLAGPQHSDAIGTAYYYYSATLMARLAEIVGKADDVRKYKELAQQIKAAFVREFVKEDGRIVDAKGETGQTFYALAFGLDLVPDAQRELVAQQFVKEIEKQDWHLATGFLGTPFVLFALEKAGQTDLAYRLVLNKTYPSWLLQVRTWLDNHVGAVGRLAARQGIPGPRHELVQPLLARLRGRVVAVFGGGHRHGRAGICPDHDSSANSQHPARDCLRARIVRLDSRTDRQRLEARRGRLPA